MTPLEKNFTFWQKNQKATKQKSIKTRAENKLSKEVRL